MEAKCLRSQERSRHAGSHTDEVGRTLGSVEGKARQLWGDLTDDDLDVAEGTMKR